LKKNKAIGYVAGKRWIGTAHKILIGNPEFKETHGVLKSR